MAAEVDQSNAAVAVVYDLRPTLQVRPRRGHHLHCEPKGHVFSSVLTSVTATGVPTVLITTGAYPFGPCGCLAINNVSIVLAGIHT